MAQKYHVPEVLSPVALLQQRELLEQLLEPRPFEPSHDLARGHVRWRRDQDMYMILTHDPFEDLNSEDLAGLPDSSRMEVMSPVRLCSGTQDPDKVVLML